MKSRDLQKEYENALKTILDIHQEQIVINAGQVLIILLEKYIAKINTPLLSCSFLEAPERKTDFILAKHCLNLLKPNHDSAYTDDEAIYHLLKYLNLHHDKLDMKQGTTQILCAFLSSYRHYADGLSAELTEQLHIHDIWSNIVENNWMYPSLTDIRDGNDIEIKCAFNKLSAIKKWVPENQAVYQQYFTFLMLRKLKDGAMDTHVKATLIDHLVNLSAWIDPSAKGEIIECLTVLIDDGDFEVNYSAKRTLKKLIDDKTCSAQINEAIENLLKRKEYLSRFGLETSLIYDIRSNIDLLCDSASPDMQAKLMESLTREFLQTSNHRHKSLLCHSLNKLHANIPVEMNDRPADQQPSLSDAQCHHLLNLDHTIREAYDLLDKLMPILNKHERTQVIHHLIENPDHSKQGFTHKLLVKYAADIDAIDKITMLARLEKLSSNAEEDKANEARSYFIEIYNLYHQSIVEKLLYKTAEQHQLPMEMTEHIWSYVQ